MKISLDKKILSLALNDKKYAMELAQATTHGYYSSDMQWLYIAMMHYFKDPNIKSVPTRDMIKEYAGDNNPEKHLALFDEVKGTKADPSEFNWMLEKLRFRYNDKVQRETRDKIDELVARAPASKERVDEINKLMKKSIVEIDSIRKRSTYKEGSLRDSASDRAKKYEYIEAHPESAQGILTGFSTFDRITNGLHPGEFMLVAGDTGCQPAGSKVLMADGRWKNIEDVVVGDDIMSPQYDGSVVTNKVTKLFKFDDKDVYKIKSKGKRQTLSYRASHNHILPIIKYSYKKHKYVGARLFEMSVDDYNSKSDYWKSKAKMFTSPAYDLPEKDFSLSPYVVGVILGDGSTKYKPNITSADPEIFDAVEGCGVSLGKPISKIGTTAKVRNIIGKDAKLVRGVIGERTSNHKCIPEEYFLGSLKQRLELLAGLIDTDGTFEEYSSTSIDLANDFRRLVMSVGGRATVKERYTSCNGKSFKSYRVHYSLAEHMPPVVLDRKANEKRNIEWKNPRNTSFEVEFDGKETVYGFSLDGDSQWYITDDYIVTHNTGKSILKQNIAVNAYLGKNTLDTPIENWDDSGRNVLFFSLEMPKETMERRIDACLAEIYSNHIRDGLLCEDDKRKYLKALKFQKEYKKDLYIVDMPKGATTREIELKYLEICETEFKPDLVVIDYLGIMSSNDSTGSDWQDLGVISAELHEFARVYEVAVLSGSQVNRTKDGSERYDTTRIARSSVIPTHANIIIQIGCRSDEYLRTDMPIYIIKMRDGERDQFTLSKDFAKMKVVDLVDTTYVDGDEDDDII
jgi:replicative DNA helicase